MQSKNSSKWGLKYLFPNDLAIFGNCKTWQQKKCKLYMYLLRKSYIVKRLDALNNSFLECCLGKKTLDPDFKGK